MDQELVFQLERLGSRLLNRFGFESQQIKSIEELSELTTAISKKMLCTLSNFKATEQDVRTEIADCFIMLFQLREMYDPVKVDTEIFYKMEKAKTYLVETLKIF